MVVRIGVAVQQVVAGGCGQRIDGRGVATFADVDHALQHRPSIPHGGGSGQSVGATWWRRCCTASVEA